MLTGDEVAVERAIGVDGKRDLERRQRASRERGRLHQLAARERTERGRTRERRRLGERERRLLRREIDRDRRQICGGEPSARFDRMPYSHQKEHVRAIMEAKKPETRERRISKAIEALSRPA